MIFNYLKLAFRLLIRNPFFTFINVLGLSVGFAVFIILWQYAQNELKSDQFQKDYERIFRLVTRLEHTVQNEQIVAELGFDTPIHAVKMAESMPPIETYTRIFNQDNFNETWIQDHSHQIFFAVNGKGNAEDYFVEDHVAYADPNIFDFFGIPLISGNPQRALSLPNSVVLSSQIARKYFGDEDPINKIILLNNSIPLTVSGVFAGLPNNTHLEFEIILSMLRLGKGIQEFKVSTHGSPVSYFKIREGVNFESLTSLLVEDSKKMTKELKEEVKDLPTLTVRTFLQPLQQVAFSNYTGDHFVPKSKVFLILLNTIALLILIVAWINYINLSLSANIKRQKELATRKTVGARPIDFIKQFLTEAIIVNVLSLLVALTIIQLAKNTLMVFFEFHVYETTHFSFHTWWIVLAVLVLGILITGIYPAISTLKISPMGLFGKHGSNHKEVTVTKVLLVIQYTSAIVLIICAFSLHEQLSYILSKNIGIKRDEVVIIDLPVKQSKNFRSSLRTFFDEISRLSLVKDFAVSNNVVGDREENSIFINHREVGIAADCHGGVDEHFLPFYEIPLLAGRNFLRDHPTDTSTLLMSLQAIKRLGYKNPEDIIGKKVIVQEVDFRGKSILAEVIGVFADYKRTTFLSELKSLSKGDEVGIALTYGDFMVPAYVPRKVSVHFATENFESGLASIKEKYDKLFPGNVFNWYFLDQNINRYYVNEKIALNQIIFFTGLVVAIACLGLLGMMTQKIVQKTKEIGIRKVLGASLHHIGSVLLVSTIRQMSIAVLIGVPLAWYLTQQYLERFSVRITLPWWHYAVPVGLLLFIMLATIASILIKAARTNPVESLRYE